MPLSDTFFIAVRRNSEGYETFDEDTLGTTSDVAHMRGDEQDELTPKFAEAYPIVRITEVTVTEKEQTNG